MFYISRKLYLIKWIANIIGNKAKNFLTEVLPFKLSFNKKSDQIFSLAEATADKISADCLFSEEFLPCLALYFKTMDVINNQIWA